MAQRFYFQTVAADDSATLAERMPVLAGQVLLKNKNQRDQKVDLNDLFRIQILAGRYQDALGTISSLRSSMPKDDHIPEKLQFIQHELFCRAELDTALNHISLVPAYTQLFNKLFKSLDDKTAYYIYTAFITRSGINDLKYDFQNKLSELQKKDSLNIDDAITLCRNYYLFRLYQNIEAVSGTLIKEDCFKRYNIDSKLIKTHDGTLINAVIILKKGISAPQPVVLQYTIYADSSDWKRIVEPAAYGYAGVIAYTRGKGLSPNKIVPYEDDGKDANDVISWISRQSWCNGKVGMYGGSYNGFTQWAAAKYHNPALKTIVPYVAAIPGLGLPMENNVFINANYGWVFYVTDNKYLDNKTYYDPQRWRSLNSNWYLSGAAYRKIDSVDGTPNPLLQRWLNHPGYDKYWQRQVPYQKDFAGINIPVLTFEGYYDDGQISGLHYMLEHLKYNPRATHYLIIGPYDHFGTQSGGVPELRGYKVDPVALIDTRDITFKWLDYILKGGQKPKILKDKINYEVMAANTWKHAPSITKMANSTMRLYLTDRKEGENYCLTTQKASKPASLIQTVDLADHKTYYGDYYPFPIIKNNIDRSNGLFFVSKPFTRSISVDGMFGGVLKAIINKKDMDITVTLYELTPDGKYFELSYFLGRASYASDMRKRALLHPGKKETIPFTRTRLVSRRLSRGSRLLVVLNVDKNAFAQVNYGTGKDVSNETAKDGNIPLIIKWSNDSYINVPVTQ